MQIGTLLSRNVRLSPEERNLNSGPRLWKLFFFFWPDFCLLFALWNCQSWMGISGYNWPFLINKWLHFSVISHLCSPWPWVWIVETTVHSYRDERVLLFMCPEYSCFKQKALARTVTCTLPCKKSIKVALHCKMFKNLQNKKRHWSQKSWISFQVLTLKTVQLWSSHKI